jgi:hypothetical protein
MTPAFNYIKKYLGSKGLTSYFAIAFQRGDEWENLAPIASLIITFTVQLAHPGTQLLMYPSGAMIA